MAAESAQNPEPRAGLRERKKQATREALSMAVLRLALERGLENVRVEDIAAEAGVSTRTFNNYFSSKYEALAARHLDRMRRAAEALRTRPADEPLWQAITEAVLAPLAGADRAQKSPDPRTVAATRLLVSGSALQSEAVRAAQVADAEFAAAVAERTGTDAERDLYPRLVAAAVTAAVQAATGQWLRADPPAPLAALLREALEQLAAGLPDPSAARPA